MSIGANKRKVRRLTSALLALFFLFSPHSQATSSAREFEPKTLRSITELPPSILRLRLQKLPEAAQQRALGWLRSFHFTANDLETLRCDSNGGVLFVCPAPAGEITEPPPPTPAEAVLAVNPLPEHLVFHSRTGSANVLYLNFCGETVRGSEWNTELDRLEIRALPFSIDTDLETFSDSEQLAIKRIWQRVSEDYAPFDVDVTTERPSTFGVRTAHALITRNTDANGDLNPEGVGSGGIAYVNVFGTYSYAKYRPAWIYYNNLGYKESNIAEAVSHEVGHNLGLSHDGTTDGSDYYAGHGTGETSWGPVMGIGYNRNVSQWSKGEYYLASNTQDDLATLAAKLSYRDDDHGDTPGTATRLLISEGFRLVSTTPEDDPGNRSPVNKGVIEHNDDVDVFSFTTADGEVDLTANPWVSPAAITRGGNLDLLAQLFSEGGTLIASSNPPLLTSAQIKTQLTAGRYFLHVRNSGMGEPLASSPTGYTKYGSLGQYFISGSVAGVAGLVVAPVAELRVTDLTMPASGPKQFTVTFSDDFSINVSSIDAADIRITGPHGYSRTAQFLGVDRNGDGSLVTATYAATPPAGTAWLPADNGTYSIAVEPNQVSDIQGAWVKPGEIGQFTVSIPATIYSADLELNPGWTLEAEWAYGMPAYTTVTGPRAGYTGSHVIGYNLSGDYGNRILMKYATTPIIDCSGSVTLTLRFRRWLRIKASDTAAIEVSADGGPWREVWSTSSGVADLGWQDVRYSLPLEVAGSRALRIRWGIASNPAQSDLGWNLDDVELLASYPEARHTLSLSVNQTGWGIVSPTNGSYAPGSKLVLEARPAPYHEFAEWRGDVTGTMDPVSVTMDRDITAIAVFREVLTTDYPTPQWWLAEHGYTNNFEGAVQSTGTNQLPLWQSYIAGLNPNDSTSQLRLWGEMNAGGTERVLWWQPVPGRVYSLWWSVNEQDGYALVPDASRLPSTVSNYLHRVDQPAATAVFYRLQVQKE